MRRLLLLAPLLLQGGCAATYTVVREAHPNPFAGQTRFALFPLEWARWEDESKGFNRDFEQAFAEEVGSHLSLAHVERGSTPPPGQAVKFFVRTMGGGAKEDTLEVRVAMQLLDPAGAALDEAWVSEGVKGGSGVLDAPAAADEVNAKKLGEALARYLLVRAAPAAGLPARR